MLVHFHFYVVVWILIKCGLCIFLLWTWWLVPFLFFLFPPKAAWYSFFRMDAWIVAMSPSYMYVVIWRCSHQFHFLMVQPIFHLMEHHSEIFCGDDGSFSSKLQPNFSLRKSGHRPPYIIFILRSPKGANHVPIPPMSAWWSDCHSMDRAWRLRVYGAMVHGVGCVFESRMAAMDSLICCPVEKTHLCMRGVGSFIAVMERYKLCMGYVGMFSPKEKLSPRWCLQPMENPTHIMHSYIYFQAVRDPIWIKICYIMKTWSGSPLLYIDGATVSQKILSWYVKLETESTFPKSLIVL